MLHQTMMNNIYHGLKIMNPNKKVLPPVYFLATLFLMACLYFTLPLRILLPPMTYIGAILIILGIIIDICSVIAFAKAGTPIKPFTVSKQLVTQGLYKFTRNPMYLGMVFILLGSAVLMGGITPILLIPLFIWIIQRNFIRHEEKMLEEIFGDNYLVYKNKVRRWI